MVKLDTHVHTSEASGCSHVTGEEHVRLYHDAGYAGIIITDHLQPLGEFAHSAEQTADQHLHGYYAAKNTGIQLGMTVLLGAEVRVHTGWEDFLVLGIDETGIRLLYELQYARMNLKRLKQECDDQGWLLYQAHPFRGYLNVANPKFLHGVETRNENPRHNNQNEKAKAFAREHGLMTLAGSDAHELEDIGVSGIYVPETVTDNVSLLQYLRQVKTPKEITPVK